MKDFTVCEEILCFFKAKELLNTELDLIGLFEQPNSQPLTHIQPRADLLNQFVQLLREQMDSATVKSAIKIRENNSRKNLKSCRKTINKYFAKFSKLLVIRVDFAFKPPLENLTPYCPDELQHPFHSEDALQLLKERIARLLKNKRHNKILNQIKGYILKFEHGLKKGFHVHALFFMDGNLHQNDGYFAHEINKYWKKLTNDQGCTYNCHMAKHKYKTLCIGMIEHTDTAKRDALDICVQYFCKKEQYFMFNKMKSVKTIQSSQPPQRGTKAGRPRKVAKTISATLLRRGDKGEF
ncbi:inovirus-type Gp2 protein [Acinetobacter johnsonii]|uniref:YagK/YfjJ domain-containing protein n=1 Tax=Acinetobacter johnsonii TaxID=40214 RepID=UPI001F41ACF4|nr:inovirus-type Gp2 protein [Acinetobacter johnsonii]